MPFRLPGLSMLLLSALLGSVACTRNDESGTKDPVSLRWTLLANDSLGRGHRAQLAIINRSLDTLPAGWALHFSSSRFIDSLLTAGFAIRNPGGDYFILSPESGTYAIAPGDTLRIPYQGRGTLTRYADAPAGPFYVTGNTARDIPVEYLFPSELEALRAAIIDRKPVPTAANRYAENARLSRLPLEETSLIVPTPQRFVTSGTFAQLPANSTVAAPEEWANELALLQSYWRDWTGQQLRVVSREELPTIQLAIDPNLLTRPEAYALEVREDDRILILAGGGAGVFYALQSLRALAPLEAFRAPVSELLLPVAIVNDMPRFRYRGLMLDVSRNFHAKSSVLELLDWMAFYKLNRLHLHLTDDEGWRLEIAGLPELTDVGARRGYSPGERDRLQPSYGSGAESDPPGSGYYTRADFIEILRYAADRHIEIIPEFDFPGHARAAILAMEARYERFHSAGNTQAAEEFRLRSSGDNSRYRSIQGYTDNVIDVCRESSYRFIEKVIDETSRLYREAGVRLAVVHTGGDEVPEGAWLASPACRDALAQRNNAASDSDAAQKELSRRFFTRVRELLWARDIRMAGWEEVALAKNGVPDTTLLDDKLLPFVWNSLGEHSDLAYRLANAGFEVVLSAAPFLYFDMAYDQHPAEPGQDWAGFIDTRRVYSLSPLRLITSLDTDRLGVPLPLERYRDELTQLTPEAAGRILGLQAQVWSETVESEERLEYVVFPRLIALAEKAWAPAPSWESIPVNRTRQEQLNNAWNRLANRLGQRELPRLDYLSGGVRYRIPPPGARKEAGKLLANVAFPGLEIRYTLDGSDPTPESARYEGPVTVPSGTRVKLRTFTTTGRGSRVVEPGR